jgi:cytochrome c5
MMKKLTLAMFVTLCLLSVNGMAASGALSGKVLFETRCTVCHDTKDVLRMKKDKKGWKATIVEMRKNGARVNDAEAVAIVNFLVKTAGR